jgi:hypothetical protein
MSRRRVVIEGESYITLEGIAECYQCELTWVREVYAIGLLGSGRPVEKSIALHVSVLDRVADVLRMSVHLGVDLAVVAALLEVDED